MIAVVIIQGIYKGITEGFNSSPLAEKHIVHYYQNIDFMYIVI